MKRRLMVILLSLTLIFTLIPMTAFADDGGTKESKVVTVTLRASTIDNKQPVSDYKIQADDVLVLNTFFYYNPSEMTNVLEHFSNDTYAPIGHILASPSIFWYPLIVPKTVGNYNNFTELNKAAFALNTQWFEEDSIIYVPMFKKINTVKLKVEAPICGTKVTVNDETDSQTNPPVASDSSSYYDVKNTYWLDSENHTKLNSSEPIKGGNTYVAIINIETKTGYAIAYDAKATIENAKLLESGTSLHDTCDCIFIAAADVKAVHNWDSGKVTKEPTAEATGVKTYTCKGCGKTKTESIPKLGSDPTQMGSDGTAVGAGASAAAAEDKITGMKTDKDPKGSKFSKLKLRSTKQTKTSITLKWKSNKKAEKYVIYGNRCGTSTKIRKSVKLYTVKKSTKTTMTKVIKKVKGAAVKKNTYYKFLVVALNKKNEVVSTSRMIHVATKGGKYTNYKGISIKKSILTKAKNLKKGKSLKLEPKQIKVTKSLKARKHVPIRYQSTNKKVATVSKYGVIKALKKGSCYVYVYAQNGVYKKVRVVVK